MTTPSKDIGIGIGWRAREVAATPAIVIVEERHLRRRTAERTGPDAKTAARSSAESQPGGHR